MGTHLPSLIHPDTRPIARTLSRWRDTAPDRAALACCGIREICLQVRHWAPRLAADGIAWRARLSYFGLLIEFVYGFAGGAERLVFIGLGGSGPGAPRGDDNRATRH